MFFQVKQEWLSNDVEIVINLDQLLAFRKIDRETDVEGGMQYEVELFHNNGRDSFVCIGEYARNDLYEAMKQAVGLAAVKKKTAKKKAAKKVAKKSAKKKAAKKPLIIKKVA